MSKWRTFYQSQQETIDDIHARLTALEKRFNLESAEGARTATALDSRITDVDLFAKATCSAAFKEDNALDARLTALESAQTPPAEPASVYVDSHGAQLRVGDWVTHRDNDGPQQISALVDPTHPLGPGVKFVGCVGTRTAAVCTLLTDPPAVGEDALKPVGEDANGTALHEGDVVKIAPSLTALPDNEWLKSQIIHSRKRQMHSR